MDSQEQKLPKPSEGFVPLAETVDKLAEIKAKTQIALAELEEVETNLCAWFKFYYDYFTYLKVSQGIEDASAHALNLSRHVYNVVDALTFLKFTVAGCGGVSEAVVKDTGEVN
jgi:hypothetical protein